MSLSNVWLTTLADGLIRADFVIGIHTHETPSVTGKRSHWLLDVVLATSNGVGQQDSWMVSPLHRTLIQTEERPVDAPQHLARLLAQLDSTNAAGVVTCSVGAPVLAQSNGAANTRENGSGGVRFRFTPFRATEPGRHYDPEYL